MNTPPVTTSAETAALIAVLNEDLAEARRIVNDMLPSERATFADQLHQLTGMLGARCKRCDALTPIGTSVTIQPLGPDRQYLCKTCADERTQQAAPDTLPPHPNHGGESPHGVH